MRACDRMIGNGFLLFAALAACTGESDPPAAPDAALLAPDAGNGAPAGYKRYIGSPITVQPGESGMWAEFVTAPFTEDMDVVDVTGTQGLGGHHAIMYATQESQPIATVRPWGSADQLGVRFLGGTGGEGGTAVKLPDGLVFRVRAGSSLLMQTHYINTTDAAIDMTSLIDIRLEPSSADNRVAGLFTNVDPGVVATPGESSLTVECELQESIDLAMWANHMHEWGARIVTTALLPDGTLIDVKRDEEWNYEWVVNANFDKRELGNPFTLPAGTLVKTECSWRNDGTTDIRFPDEMCVFFGFNSNGFDVNCVNGFWMRQ